MRKKWYKIAMLGMLGLFSTTVLGKSDVKLLTEVAYMGDSGIEWTDTSFDTPEVKITIEDAYKRAGKTEKLLIELNEAYWTDESGMNIGFFDLEGLQTRDIAIKPVNKHSVQLNIDIPSSIRKDDQVSFSFPLWIKSTNDEEEISLTIRPVDDAQLIEENTVLVATKENKRATIEVQEVPELKRAGTIADITIKELSPYSMDNQMLTVELKLNNPNYIFGNLEYLSKEEHDADVEYILKPNTYVSYEGALNQESEETKLKRYRKTEQELIFKLNGNYVTNMGKITLTNIPIVDISSNYNEEEITLTITSDELVGSPKKVVVAQIVEKTNEEKAEEELKEMVQEANEQAEKAEQERIEAGKVSFQVGTNYYIKNNEQYEMDGYTYIQEPGYTMVPVRYVAAALGLDEKDIEYVDGRVTIHYIDRNIEITIGESLAKVNGNEITMETAAVISNGRSYVPVGEIAKLLGINREWDSRNKTATFYK